MKGLLRFFAFSLLIYLSTSPKVEGQSKSEDVVYLKNGSIVHGTIVDSLPNQSIKIQTADHNVFIFKTEDVLRITKSVSDYYPQNKTKKNHPFVNYVDIGYATGIGNASLTVIGLGGGTGKHGNDYHSFGIRDVIGFRENSNVTFGLGFGYEHYSGNPDYLPATEYLPAFLSIRAYANSETNTSVGFLADIGFKIGLTKSENSTYDPTFGGISVKDQFKGGFFLDPSVSLRVRMNTKTFLCLSVGYEYQNINIEESITMTSGSYYGFPFGQTFSESLTLTSSFITFKAGIEF